MSNETIALDAATVEAMAEVIDAILGFLYGSLAHSPGDAHIRASLQQFTRDNMRRNFNPSNPNDLQVKYYSVAGRSAARVAAAECAGKFSVGDKPSIADCYLTNSISRASPTMAECSAIFVGGEVGATGTHG